MLLLLRPLGPAELPRPWLLGQGSAAASLLPCCQACTLRALPLMLLLLAKLGAVARVAIAAGLTLLHRLSSSGGEQRGHVHPALPAGVVLEGTACRMGVGWAAAAAVQHV